MDGAIRFSGSDAVLVANRGEIAVRVIRAAHELGLRAVAVYAADDADALHVRRADLAVPLAGAGARAYLDGEALVAAATDAGAGAVHPGYGFLSEQAAFARQCAAAGLTFVGPRPEVLDLFGDKVAARALAEEAGVPVLAGTSGATTLDEARRFLAAHPAGVMLKAVAGGGGRGMRAVRDADALDAAYERCRSEARAAFGGEGAVYVEELLLHPRHLEVQVLGDGTGAVAHLGERDCSVQRRHQKLIEIAPAPFLSPEQHRRLTDAALRLAAAARYDGVGTVEFLVQDERVTFMEANARLQVEHTVTEEVTGVDLVHTQLRLAAGATLADLGLVPEAPAARGVAIQVRVNAETLAPDGSVRPAAGTLTAFEVPTGPGVRTDTGAYPGYRVGTGYDPLLAKVIGHAPAGGFDAAVARTARAMDELHVEGVATNAGLLRAVLGHPAFTAGPLDTAFLDAHLAELLAAVPAFGEPAPATAGASTKAGAGAKVDSTDPLAVLAHGQTRAPTGGPVAAAWTAPDDGTVAAPMQGTIVSLPVRVGDPVRAGDTVVVMEAMKMEHLVAATVDGHVRRVAVAVGDTVFEGHPLVFVEPGSVEGERTDADADLDLDAIRPDLAEVLHRQALTQDPARPDAVARRRRTGQRTARENVEDLVDPGSFVEWGSLAIAAQRARRPVSELIERTPADGLVSGTARINGDLFDDDRARCVVMSYDYTVLAGTQGQQNHRKKDRLFELAERLRLPVVVFTEGGGGRPGDTDGIGVAGLDCLAFMLFGGLSGLVPLVGINSGRCFAGNAALLGCCDVVIATANSSIGMGGPAMIEGGGLGVFHPDEVGPMGVQVPNGVVDIPVADEAEAVAVAKRYLSYFQGPIGEWTCADQRRLRHLIPENRLRVYDVRRVIDTLADTGSVLELRREFGPGMVTAFVRIEGRPLGLIANDPVHLAGAITSDGADKAARFMQLCDAFDLPLLFLCDTPGMMVGPEVEKTALVRHCSRMFVTGASLTVPFFTVVLRKGYGLGAQAMAGGSFRAPIFTVAWPTGEFGGMGLEGAVKLGYRNELAAIEDPDERKAAFEQRVARSYEHGKALNTASHLEIDDVIDPRDTRQRVVEALRAAPPAPPPASRPRKRPCIDTW